MECFRLLFDHLAWIEHQFFSGIRHSRKAGSLWGMMRCVGEVSQNTGDDWPNKNFIDKDRHVSIETISAQFWCQCGNCTHNHLWGTEDTEDLREVCPKGAQRRSERKTLSWQQGDGRAGQFRSGSSWCSGDQQWKLDLLLWARDQETEFPVEACWFSQTQECQTEQIHPQTFNDPFFWQHWHDLHALGSHWTGSQQGILCWGFKGVQEEIL